MRRRAESMLRTCLGSVWHSGGHARPSKRAALRRRIASAESWKIRARKARPRLAAHRHCRHSSCQSQVRCLVSPQGPQMLQQWSQHASLGKGGRAPRDCGSSAEPRAWRAEKPCGCVGKRARRLVRCSLARDPFASIRCGSWIHRAWLDGSWTAAALDWRAAATTVLLVTTTRTCVAPEAHAVPHRSAEVEAERCQQLRERHALCCCFASVPCLASTTTCKSCIWQLPNRGELKQVLEKQPGGTAPENKSPWIAAGCQRDGLCGDHEQTLSAPCLRLPAGDSRVVELVAIWFVASNDGAGLPLVAMVTTHACTTIARGRISALRCDKLDSEAAKPL